MNGIKIFSAFALVAIFLSISAKGQDSLIINEFMALNNTTLQDEDGNFEDWIEIYNSGSTDVDLEGWSLTDEADNFFKWKFPKFTLAAGEYLVVFASGKDRKLEKDKLHTNFKLNGTGEFLGLGKPDGSQFVSLFAPNYVVQYPDVSYGLLNESYTYCTNPTPGSENSYSPYVTTPQFSIEHGYYNTPFTLELTSNLDTADIYFTSDASTPSETNGQKYTDPITINTTTIIRAVVVKEGLGTGPTKTQSYIFPNNIVNQPTVPVGYPATWLSPVHGTNNYFEIPGNYDMKERFDTIPVVHNVLVQSLESLPVVSIVSDIDNFFSKSTNPDSGGIYMYNGEPDGPTIDLKYHLGRGWIRPASIEYFNSDQADGSLDFQANCGIKIHGGACRTRAKTEKHSFSIGFKSEYGPSKLEEKVFGKGSPKQYDWLILRGGFAPRLGLQIKDPWAKSTLSDMGQYAARSKFVHVYLNGLYWGMYNLSERLDDNCMRDNLGGKASDYDIMKDYDELASGDTIAWTKLVTMAGDNIESNENYQKLLGNNADGTPNPAYEKMVNPVNLVDYILMNFYAGTTDWDNHNWVAARNKTESDGFHFLPWDCESVLGSVSTNRVAGNIYDNRPTGIFTDLMKNSEFSNLFISHVTKHFFEGGALTPDPGLTRYRNWFSQIDTALIADQARWVSNMNDIWNLSYHSFIYAYFSRRTEIVFNQLINTGMYPSIDPPLFNTESNKIPKDFQLFMSAPSGGEIRYSLDGTDPGYYSPLVKKSILTYDNNAIPITSDTLNILARVKKDTLWSKLVTKQFLVGINTGIINEPLSSIFTHFYNYPNPVKDYTQIMYSLNEACLIRLSLFAVTGEQITVLEDGIKPAGENQVTWNSANIPAGVYICVLENMSDSTKARIKIIKE